MKPVVVRLYVLLIVLSLAGLLVWSGADWYQRQQAALVSGHGTLRQAAGLVSDFTIRDQVLDTAALNRVFSKTAADGRWKMVLLSSDRGTEYYRGPRPPVSVDRAVPHWEARTPSEVKIVLPVFRASGGSMVVEGIYEFYGRPEVFGLLRAGGITFVALLLLTTLMVFFLSRRNAEPEGESAPEPEAPVHHETADNPDDGEYWFDENLTLDLPPMAELSKDQGSDSSLFSPRSGLGWESFLVTRLDHELQRCASQNQDLSLILFAAKSENPAPEAWGEAVRKAFPSADLDFEFEGGVAVVLPGQSLEQALKAARSFVESVSSDLGTIHAGVSARTGRLLSAQTLLGEASSARRRSLSGTVKVMGLKTDPDRYREHLASASA